jgi:ParB family chromosome partitioning protein
VTRRALGKGLEALIPEGRGEGGADREQVVNIDIDEISSNPYQPRSKMSEVSLDDLRESITEKGVLQPVIVRRKAGRYELVAGERRLRAARLAHLKSVPALVRKVSDSEALEIALVENLQREDLNPLDEARGYRELMKRFELTQDQLSQKIGKDRSTIANVLRLLKLPETVRQGLEEGKIAMGHARALLGLEDERHVEGVYHRLVHRGLSVRQVEGEVRRKNRSRSRKQRPQKAVDPQIARIEDDLMKKLGTRVRLVYHGGHGRLEVEFYSDDDLNRILEAIGG